MTLTITQPARVTPAYNPIIIEAVSDVSSDFTIGSAILFDSISSNNGNCELAFSDPHGLLKGDYLLITEAPDAEYILGVALVTKVIDTTTLVINKVFVNDLSATGTLFKYLNNYSAYIKFYVYTDDAPTTPKFALDLTLKPKFEGGFCKFDIDVSSIVRNYCFRGFNVDDVLKYNLIPSNQYTFINKKSFVHWGTEISEAFDNPQGGFPTFEQDIEAEV